MEELRSSGVGGGEIKEKWTRPDPLLLYDRLFGYSSPFPAHETRYSCRDPFREAQELADIAGFYRAFGLALEGEASEMGDHIAVELEFLGLAAYREAQALSGGLQEQAEICREAQARFMTDHLGRWAPAFLERLAHGQAGIYSHVARIALKFLDEEKEFLGVAFEPFQLPNLAEADDEECLTCPAAGAEEYR